MEENLSVLRAYTFKNIHNDFKIIITSDPKIVNNVTFELSGNITVNDVYLLVEDLKTILNRLNDVVKPVG